MTGVGIDEGDFILVDRSISPRSGQIVVAIVDGDYTVKRLDLKNGMIRLVAENEKFTPITPKECQEIEIWGVVVASIKPFIKLIPA
jgi:DNA polymerase V